MTGDDVTLDAVLAIDPEAADLLFREARSATAFVDEPVDDRTLRAIYDLVKFGPTSLNQQPLRIVVVRDGPGRARLLPHLNPRNRERAASAPAVLILAMDTAFHERLPEVFPHAAGLREVLDPQPDDRFRQATLERDAPDRVPDDRDPGRRPRRRPDDRL